MPSLTVFLLAVRVHLDADATDRNEDPIQFAVGGHGMREPQWRRRSADLEDGDDRVGVRIDHRDARVQNEIGSACIVDALIAAVERELEPLTRLTSTTCPNLPIVASTFTVSVDSCRIPDFW